MLYRAEFMYISVLRHNHKTAWMLSRCSLYTCTASNKTVYLRIVQYKMMVVHISFYITVGCFIRKRAYCSGLENMALAEKHLCIGMSLLLVFAGKVKVNIRLFVTVESEEGFKRNVVSVLTHHCSALRAGFVRHVHS